MSAARRAQRGRPPSRGQVDDQDRGASRRRQTDPGGRGRNQRREQAVSRSQQLDEAAKAFRQLTNGHKRIGQ